MNRPISMKPRQWLVVIFLMTASFAFAQTDRVTINRQNVPLKTILNDIEQSTHYLFVYDSGVDVNRKISVSVSRKPLNEVLQLLFKGTQVSYRLTGKHIILSVVPKAKNGADAPAKKRQVAGIVTDDRGEPLVGVTVCEEGTRNVALTDVNGRFAIAADDGAKLVFSYIGFKSARRAARRAPQHAHRACHVCQ